MAIEYTLTDVDTLRGLGNRYNVDWKTIADFNGLEYPYTLTSRDALHELYASGYLLITRALYTTPVTLFAGSLFATEVDAQGIRKVYQLVDDLDMVAGEASAYGFVRCTEYGTYGNTIQDTIVRPQQVLSSLGDYLSPLTVTNPEPIANGADAKVRITGQTVLIPTDEDLSGEIKQQVHLDNYINQVGGEDLELLLDGDISDDGMGDLGSVIGVENIAQAIRHRLMTPRGSLLKHPDYGSDIHSLIGRGYLPYINSLIEVYIHDALRSDDRFRDVVVHSIAISGTTITVEISVYVVQADQHMTTGLMDLTYNTAA